MTVKYQGAMFQELPTPEFVFPAKTTVPCKKTGPQYSTMQ